MDLQGVSLHRQGSADFCLDFRFFEYLRKPDQQHDGGHGGECTDLHIVSVSSERYCRCQAANACADNGDVKRLRVVVVGSCHFALSLPSIDASLIYPLCGISLKGGYCAAHPFNLAYVRALTDGYPFSRRRNDTAEVGPGRSWSKEIDAGRPKNK